MDDYVENPSSAGGAATGCIRFAAGSCRGWRQPASSRWPPAGSGALVSPRRTTSRGESYRIMYLHVPAGHLVDGVSMRRWRWRRFTGLVWQMKMASLAVAAMAPVGGGVTPSSRWSPARRGATDVGHLVGVGRAPEPRSWCCCFSTPGSSPCGTPLTTVKWPGARRAFWCWSAW
ncbi:heme exporter protein C [Salmonella enterica subsp. enterica]|uniref:Heme exporter protein C n=1 Tax=Salmonella enterica I TaxID=59201 RepID=A0A447N7G2_SALET|nr:heme exporter protein C [Salmonella enterica subsp. enterica]